MATRGKEYLLLADEDLMSFIESGDTQAFEALYDRYRRAAYRMAYRIMGETQAAEDLVQEAFVKVWRAAQEAIGCTEAVHVPGCSL